METNKIYNMDCLEGMKQLPKEKIKLILTDPPFPDIKKDFKITPIDFLKNFNCRQLIFWSAIEPFPLDFTAIHIFHKPNGCSSQHYERIFERKGNKVCRVYRYGTINSKVSAQMLKDVYTKHPTQKPLNLIKDLIEKYTKKGDLVVDCFIGSGTTAVACIQTGRNFIGFEIDKEYYNIALERIKSAKSQTQLSNESCPTESLI